MLLEKTQRADGVRGSQEGREHLPATNHSVALVLRGSLDAQVLLQSVRDLSEKYPWLRKRIFAGILVQFADLGSLDADERARYEQGCQSRDLDTPFNPVNGPLLRATLLKLEPDVHALTLTTSLSICEPAALGDLVKALGVAYTANIGQATAVQPTSPDVLVTRESPAAGDVQDDSGSELPRAAAVAREVPAPALLPTDRARHGANKRLASITFKIDERSCRKSKQFAVGCGVDEMSVYLAAYVLLLGRFTRTADVAVSLNKAELAAAAFTALLGSSGALATIGIGMDKDGTGEQLVSNVRGVLEDELSIARLQEPDLLSDRDAALRPLVAFRFSALLDLELTGFEGLTVQLRPVRGGLGSCEAVLTLLQGPQDVEAEWHYDASLFDAETIRGWAGCYLTLLRSLAVEGGSPAALLELTSDDQRLALAAWNTSPARADTAGHLHGVVSAQALRVPEQLALVSSDAQITYRELDARSGALALRLRSRGTLQGNRVGVLLEPGIDLVLASLGVLKAGAACVPLDPTLAPDLLGRLMQSAELDLLVSRSDRMRSDLADRVPVLLLDEEAARGTGKGGVPPQPDQPEVSPEEPAFVICTVHSTAVLRFAVLPHRAMVRCLQGIASRPGFDGSDTLLAFADAGSLAWSLELFAALAVGAQVIIAGPEHRAEPSRMKALLDSRSVTIMQAGRSTWQGLIGEGWQHTRTFKALIQADQLDRTLASELLRRASELWCFYGPMEATGWATSARVQDPEILPASVPGTAPRRLIGKPNAHSTIWVVDERGELCPLGVPGEIRVGGACLASSYLGERPLTAERFVPDLIGTHAGGKLFRTGDIGRWRHDGVLEHLGPLSGVAETLPEAVPDASPKALQGIDQEIKPARVPERAPEQAAVPAAEPTPERAAERSPEQGPEQARERRASIFRAFGGPAGESRTKAGGAGESVVRTGSEAKTTSPRRGEVEPPLYAMTSDPAYDAMLATDPEDLDGSDAPEWDDDRPDEAVRRFGAASKAADGAGRLRPTRRMAVAALVGVVLLAGASWVAWQQVAVEPVVAADAAAPVPAAAEGPLVSAAPAAPSPPEVASLRDDTPGPSSVPAGSGSSQLPVTRPAGAVVTSVPRQELSSPGQRKEAATPPVPKEAVVTAPSKEAVAASASKETPIAPPSTEAIASTSGKEMVAAAPGKETVPATAPQAPAAAASPRPPAAAGPARDSGAATSSKVPAAATSSKEPVAAASSKEPVVGASPKDPVAAPSPKEPVAALSPNAAVAVPVTREAAAAVSAKEPTAAAFAKETIAAVPAKEPVAATAAKEPPAAMPAKEPVAALPSRETASTPSKDAAPALAPKEPVNPSARKETVGPVPQKEAPSVKEVLPVTPSAIASETTVPQQAKAAEPLPPWKPEAAVAANLAKQGVPGSNPAPAQAVSAVPAEAPPPSGAPATAALVQPPPEASQECRRELQLLGLCRKPFGSAAPRAADDAQ